VKKFTTIVSIFFIFLFVYYILLNPEVLNIFEILTIQSIVILIFIKFIMLILNSLFNKSLIKAFDIDLLNFESLYIGSITFLGNLYLPGRIGGGFRLIYLNKTYNLKSSFLVSSLVYFFVISFFINSLIGFFSLFLNFEYLNSSLLIWLFIYGFSFLFSFYLLFKNFELKKIEEFKSKIFYKISSYFQEAKSGWITITKFKNMNRNLISIYIINYIFFVIDIYLITTFINISLSLSNVVFFNSINIFSGLIGITPGSIGLKESLMFLSINIFELTFEELFQIILIERLISVVFSIIPILVVLTYNKKIKTSFFK
jgi:uncharacterized protein (TIRG00374 family)